MQPRKMRLRMKHIAIFAAVALLATACVPVNPKNQSANEPAQYAIDGSTFTGNITNEFIYRMLDMAHEGHTVSFSSDTSHNKSTGVRATYTYSTRNREQAFRWARRMAQNGFTITVSYNKRTAEYNCRATK